MSARAAPAWRATLTQAGMELRLLVRSPESLLVTLGVPLGILVFFSSVDVLPTGDDDAVTFLVPGVLAISVMSTGLVALAIQTAFERKYGVLKRLGGTPLSRGSFLVAKGLAVAAMLAIQTTIVLAVAVVGLGWSPSGSLVAVLTAMVLGTAAFAGLGLLMAGTLRAEATLGLSNALYLILLVLSGVMFESDALPGGLEAAGRVLPSGALGQALRQAVEPSPSVDVAALLVLAGWAVLAGSIASRTFRWDP